MILEFALLHYSIILVFILLLQPTFPSKTPLKPNCPKWCGNLSISYPFGVGAECSLDPSFHIICNTSTNPPKPYLFLFDNFQVVEIMATQIRVANPYLLNAICYDEGGESKSSDTERMWTGLSLMGTQYTFSEDNWLTALGCDDLLLGIGEDDSRFGGGCVAYCRDGSYPIDFGFCPNNDDGYLRNYGCCHNPIPKGITMLGAQVTDLSRRWRKRKLFPCSYAFILEKPMSNDSLIFYYSLSYLNNLTAFDQDYWRVTNGGMPVLRLDWRIGSQNCTQAQRNLTTYACRDNTYCLDYGTQVQGYLCQCKDGYHGNPYITCQDIDECGDDPCDSNSVCINTPGSFVCSCPKWYNGDGRKDGKGCTPSVFIFLLIGLSSGVGIMLVMSTCLLWSKRLQSTNDKIRKQRFFKQNGGLLLQKHTNESLYRKTILFSAQDLDKATDHFNQSRIIGQGGQGKVYKGMLSDGNIVAIKKSKLVNKPQLEQFINEVVILSHINHRNIVKLLGCCLEAEVPLLVYEYMPNGTLFDLIREPNTEFRVSWSMRLKMAADVAGALMYLHSASSRPIYHRDIKSSNILLDEKYVVKLSDFGISRLVANDQTHLTTMVKGTFGYFDPEYYQTHQFTEKSDVYSFGVVLLELLTGLKAVSREEEDWSLVTRFLISMEEDNLETMLDSRVLEEGVKKEMITVASLAERCLNLNGKMRPTMKEVATVLESLRMSNVPTVDHKFEGKATVRAKSVKISNHEYTWTGTSSTFESLYG